MGLGLYANFGELVCYVGVYVGIVVICHLHGGEPKIFSRLCIVLCESAMPC